ncbi:MAG: hypothetical protein ACI8QF_004387, partial [Limisphaerales bacterium]
MMRRGVHLLKRPPQIAAAIQCRWGESPREPNSVSRRDYRDSGVLSGLRYGLARTLAPPAFWLPSVLSRSLAFLLAAAISLISSTFAFSANETIASESDQTTQILEPSLTEKNRQHWSFRPLHRSKPPHVKNESQVRNEIDRFILVDLEAEGLRFAPEASRETLIRRVHFDLIGLPPSPAQIDAFANDASPDAYEKVVNRLLVADGYGEHWAQHWLDLARFAQSDGFEHDKVRPDAWRYRDWVIRALNDDLPYDQFVQWQIAGDELAPDNPDAALATG